MIRECLNERNPYRFSTGAMVGFSRMEGIVQSTTGLCGAVDLFPASPTSLPSMGGLVARGSWLLEDALVVLNKTWDESDPPFFDALVHPGNVVFDCHNCNDWMRARSESSDNKYKHRRKLANRANYDALRSFRIFSSIPAGAWKQKPASQIRPARHPGCAQIPDKWPLAWSV